MFDTILTYVVLVVGGVSIVGLRFFFAVRDVKKAEEKNEKDWQVFSTRKEKKYV